MSRFLRQYWIIPLSILLGVYVFSPFLAPVFMNAGWNSPARLIYFIYSWLCHQLPERSFFLFGAKFTYSLTEIQNAWQNTINPGILRQFIGTPQMGWKIAWSDRMVSMFISLWLFGILWWPVRRRLKRLPWWGLVLFLLPMALDGISHFFSDLAGIGMGYRYSNLWLAVLTQRVLPTNFYLGEAWGSFNSLMRLLTGVLFGIGFVWYTYPYLDTAFSRRARAETMNTQSLPTKGYEKSSL